MQLRVISLDRQRSECSGGEDVCDNLRGLSTAKSYYHINPTFSLLPPVHRRLNSEATMFYLSVAVVLGRWIFCQLICYKRSSRNQGINWLRVVVVKWLSLSFQQLFRAQLIRMEHAQKDQLCHVTAIFFIFSSFNSRPHETRWRRIGQVHFLCVVYGPTEEEGNHV